MIITGSTIVGSPDCVFTIVKLARPTMVASLGVSPQRTLDVLNGLGVGEGRPAGVVRRLIRTHERQI